MVIIYTDTTHGLFPNSIKHIAIYFNWYAITQYYTN